MKVEKSLYLIRAAEAFTASTFKLHDRVRANGFHRGLRTAGLAVAVLLLALIVAPPAHAAQFTLRWQDNAANETGFKVERSVDGSAYSEVASVGVNVTSYIDAGLTSGKKYWYRVRAYNAKGMSAYSNVASGTTPLASVNQAPTISDIGDRSTHTGTSTGAISFAVADVETAAASLKVSVSSSDTSLVPQAGLVLGGTGSSRSITVTPASGKIGKAMVTVSVSDGSLTASDSFAVTVCEPGSSVLGGADGFCNTPLSGARTGQFAVTFDATPLGNPIDGVIGLSRSAVGAFSDFAAIVRFSEAGTIDARSGGTYTASKAIPYSAGVTYRFRLVLDVTSRTYSAYVTAPGGAESTIGTGLAFRTEQAGVTSLGNWCSTVVASGTDSKLIVSNFVEVVTNTAPTISAISNRTIDEDGSTGAIGFTISDGQTSAGALNVSATTSNPALVPAGNIVLGGSGANRTISVSPATNQSGSATITISVDDGALSTTRAFVVSVNAVNDAPFLSSIASVSMMEDSSAGPITFTIGDVETAAASLTITAKSSNTSLIPADGIVLGGSGANRTLTLTPAADESGTVTVTVSVSDGALTVTESFSVTVKEVNDAPSISPVSNLAISEDSSSGAIAFTVGDVETPAGSLVVSVTSSNEKLIPASGIALGGSGANRNVTVSPAADENGAATIVVSVSDGELTASTSFVLTVTAVNDAPIISPIGNQSVHACASSSAIEILVSDAETEAGSLVVTATSSDATLVPAGALVLGGSGADRTLVVTPAPGQTGSVRITVTVNDGKLSASEEFELSVTAATALEAGAGEGFVNIPLYAPQDGEFVVCFEATPSGSNIDAVIGLSAKQAAAYTDLAAAVRFNPSGMIDARNGSAYTADAAIAYAAGKTYQFRAVIDVRSRTYAVYVTAPGGAEQTVGRKLAFRTEQGSVKSLAYAAAVVTSASTGQRVTVTGFVATPVPVNTAPVISKVADIGIAQGGSTGAIAFTVGDAETAAGALIVSASSSNPALLPQTAFVFGGSEASRSVTVSPAVGQSGTATVTLSVTDGELAATSVFVITVSGARTQVATAGAEFSNTPLSRARSDRFTMEFSARPSAGNVDAVVALSPAPASGYQDLAAIVRFNPAGTIDARSGGAYTTGTIPYAAEVTYRFRLVVDVPSHTYSAYVTAPGGKELTVGTALAFRSEHAAAASLSHWSMAVERRSIGQSLTVSDFVETSMDDVRTLDGMVAILAVSENDAAIQPVAAMQANAQKWASLSVRGPVGAGEEAMIVGFRIQGSSSKRLLIRAVGPALSDLGVTNALRDPRLVLVRDGSETDVSPVAQSDDASQEAAGAAAEVGAFPLPAGGKDAALVVTLPAGGYSVHVESADTSTGVVLVEIYDAESDLLVSTASISSFSVRGCVRGGEEGLIAGLAIVGVGSNSVLVQAVGPELAAVGVDNALLDPTVSVYRRTASAETLVAASDNSTASDRNAAGAFNLDADSKSAAVVVSTEPGIYTVYVRGAGSSSGIALLELLSLP